MHIVDSCGWLEWFSNGMLADAYGPYLRAIDQLLIPGVVLYEVYKILKRETGEEKAVLAVSYMTRSLVVSVDEVLALNAAEVALQEGLAMADAMVYAVALMHDCLLYTSDADFKGLPQVEWMGG